MLGKSVEGVLSMGPTPSVLLSWTTNDFRTKNLEVFEYKGTKQYISFMCTNMYAGTLPQLNKYMYISPKRFYQSQATNQSVDECILRQSEKDNT